MQAQVNKTDLRFRLFAQPNKKRDESNMLVAAAVTMAPPAECADFILSLSENERCGAMPWMDPKVCTDVSSMY
jgi:hypothetical protein